MKAYLLATFVSFLAVFFAVRSFDFLESKKKKFFSQIADVDIDSLMLAIVKYAILTIVVILVTGVFLLNYPFGPDGKSYEPNKFGDFFGGTIGPIFSFLSFVALLWTIRAQDLFSKQSLMSQSQQLNLAIQQRDEESFFLMLGRFHELADSDRTSHTQSVLTNAYEYCMIMRQNSKDGNWNSDTLLLKMNERVHSFCGSIRIRFSLLCRIVEHIEASSMPDKKRAMLILKSFMSESEIYLFYGLAAAASFEESDIFKKLYSSFFLAKLSKNPPPYIAAIQQLSQDPSSTIFHESIFIDNYLN